MDVWGLQEWKRRMLNPLKHPCRLKKFPSHSHGIAACKNVWLLRLGHGYRSHILCGLFSLWCFKTFSSLCLVHGGRQRSTLEIVGSDILFSNQLNSSFPSFSSLLTALTRPTLCEKREGKAFGCVGAEERQEGGRRISNLARDVK